MALKLKAAIENGTKNDTDLKCFSKMFNKLSIIKDLIVKGNRIYIPSSLRKKLLNAARERHQGIIKTKQLLRSKIWHPQMDREIELLIQNCLPCQAATLQNCQEPLEMTQLPSEPWEQIAVEFKGLLPSEDYLLVIIDEYLRFVETEMKKSTSMKSAIPKVDKVFSLFHIPLKVKSDNGLSFDCGDFDKYAKYLGFIHQCITLAYFKAYGLVENLNRMTNKLLRIANVKHKNWKQELHKFFRNYTATPHTTTGNSSSEIIFPNRTFKTRIPDFIDNKDEIKDEDIRKKDAQKK